MARAADVTVAPRRFDDPAPPSAVAVAARLATARWGAVLAFVVVATIAMFAVLAIVLARAGAAAMLAAAVAATPVVAVVSADAAPADVAALGDSMRALPGVASATPRPKDDALRTLVAAGLPPVEGRNPLPDLWIVIPDPGAIAASGRTVAEGLAALRAAVVKLAGVEAVRVDDRWVAAADALQVRTAGALAVATPAVLALAFLVLAATALLAGTSLGDPQRASSKWSLALVGAFVAVVANSLALAVVYVLARAADGAAASTVDRVLANGQAERLLWVASALASLVVCATFAALGGRRSIVKAGGESTSQLQ